MKSPAFAYARPESLDEAFQLLAENEDAKIMAGGQSLLPVLALRLGSPDLIVDISRISGLDSIDVDAAGNLTIGAMVRHSAVEESDDVAVFAPLVAEAAPYIGHRAIRNRGTTVGSIAHADPAAEMPAVCLATDAVMIAQSPRGRREIPAAEFFVGFLETALEADEILIAVRFPAVPVGTTGSVVELSRRHGDYALVGLATRLHVADKIITDAALAFLSVGPTAVRVSEAEAVLVGERPSAELFREAARVVSATLQPAADVHASANYRKHLAGVLTTRGLERAIARLEVSP